MSSYNLNYTVESSDLVYNLTDAEGVSTQVIYNLGDMAWGEFITRRVVFTSLTVQ